MGLGWIGVRRGTVAAGPKLIPIPVLIDFLIY
jgi:hypothetical protein